MGLRDGRHGDRRGADSGGLSRFDPGNHQRVAGAGQGWKAAGVARGGLGDGDGVAGRARRTDAAHADRGIVAAREPGDDRVVAVEDQADAADDARYAPPASGC